MSPASKIDAPAPVRPGEELPLEPLAAYLREALGEAQGGLTVEQFPRGFSNLTYLLRWGDRQLVLRRPPFGAAIKSAHDMGREFRILSSLQGVYPKIPRALTYCQEEAVLGAPFYVMERVEGVILRPGLKPEQSPEAPVMAAIARSLVATLAELHGVDVAAAGLEDLGRPEGYARRQIEGWTKRYGAARTDEIPEMEQVAAWLASRVASQVASQVARQVPGSCRRALIHNDFKYDNVVLDPQDLPRVRAVLDWEMATLGDPWMDLGTSLGYWVDPDDPPAMRALALSPTTLPGNPTREEVVALYEAFSGRPVEDPVFYYVYGLFKIAVIVQQIYARYRRGDTQDPRFANLIEGVKSCARTARQAVDRQRLDRLYS
jgi:aminoglycoside phosphotransferase (APT) family kinase protein